MNCYSMFMVQKKKENKQQCTIFLKVTEQDLSYTSIQSDLLSPVTVINPFYLSI